MWKKYYPCNLTILFYNPVKTTLLYACKKKVFQTSFDQQQYKITWFQMSTNFLIFLETFLKCVAHNFHFKTSFEINLQTQYLFDIQQKKISIYISRVYCFSVYSISCTKIIILEIKHNYFFLFDVVEMEGDYFFTISNFVWNSDCWHKNTS
jgi:hypothetical protein